MWFICLILKALYDYHTLNENFLQIESYSEVVQTQALTRFYGILEPDQFDGRINSQIETNQSYKC
jgi:hypothetical protein